jgi:starch synthase (maltosyl-transferring)
MNNAQAGTFDGRKRVIIEGVRPEIDGGRYAIKRVTGEKVVVEADIFCDGHDLISSVMKYRRENEEHWHECEMEPLVNDRWRASFTVDEQVRYCYTLLAWVDHFKSWRRDFRKKLDAGVAEEIDLQAAIHLMEECAGRASEEDRHWLHTRKEKLADSRPFAERAEDALREDLAQVMFLYSSREFATHYNKVLWVWVDREKARFSAWYEFFPRSSSDTEGVHGTFRDAEKWIPYIAEMGFDVIYFPPIHPVGRINRKGKNNAVTAEPDDVGSPWAIGSEEGGHKSVNPELGTLEDFNNFCRKAEEFGIEIALDIAFQCAPDHPYVREHPEWFRHRPDGSIQYAENPPKKYEDIYPFDFESRDWKGLWEELRSVFLFWIEQGVRIFRVDNPHTKAFPFWEWCIADIHKAYPDVIFLAEAFTRPRIMHNLGKLGYTQSYTYFTWRNQKWEIEQYFNELTKTDVREYYRPNLWPNTPDILHEYLQTGGRPAFIIRFILAATLGANYGIYGPAFELQEHVPRNPGSEEYLNSEKYQLRHWDLNRPDSLREIITIVNQIRRENPALQSGWNLQFHPVDNEQLICYSRYTEDFSNILLVIVNLDPFHTQSGWVEIPVNELPLEPEHAYQVHDLITEARYIWQGSRNYVELNPYVFPAHVLRLKRKHRTERDFDYFM